MATASNSPLLRVGAITVDPALTRALEAVVKSCGGRLTVAVDRAAATDLLESPDEDAMIVDFSARGLLPTPSIFPAQGDDLLFVCRSRNAGAPRASASSYARAELPLVLERIRRLAPPSSNVVSTILGSVDDVREQIARVARFPDVPVFIFGETGTGKELVANAIHDLGGGPGRPFVAINCAAIPAELFESEIFGHQDGAFTGARGQRLGLMEAARGGTLFLDEISEMPAALQPKLLRALESRSFRRVGSNVSIPLEARVLSASNRLDLGQGPSRLRPDVYYRLAGFHIALPPLRERRGDVMLLARHFLDAFSDRHGEGRVSVSEDAEALLLAHPWPGNVRELKAMIERAAITAKDAEITAASLEAALGPASHASTAAATSRRDETSPAAASPESRPFREVQREIVLKTFAQHGNNLSKAALELRIPRSTLRDMIRRYRDAVAAPTHE